MRCFWPRLHGVVRVAFGAALFAAGWGSAASGQDGDQGLVSAYFEPAPEILELTGKARWDGRPTLKGIWIAHPDAESPRRARIFNIRTGKAVDGALFRREGTLADTNVLISAEAARAIGLQPDEPADIRIVAIKPVSGASGAKPAAGSGAEGGAPARTGGSGTALSVDRKSPASGDASAKPVARAETGKSTATDGKIGTAGDAPPHTTSLAAASAPEKADTKAGVVAAKQAPAPAPANADMDGADRTAAVAKEKEKAAAAGPSGDTSAIPAPVPVPTPAAAPDAPKAAVADGAETSRESLLSAAGAASARQARPRHLPAKAPIERRRAELARRTTLTAAASRPATATAEPKMPSIDRVKPASGAALSGTKTPSPAVAKAFATPGSTAATAPAGPTMPTAPAREKAVARATAPATRLVTARPAPAATSTAPAKPAVPSRIATPVKDPAAPLRTTRSMAPTKPAAAEKLSHPYVQAGLFGVESNAASLVKRLQAGGVPAFGRTIRNGSRTLTRVLAGPFKTAEARDRAQRTIRAMGLRDAVPVSR